MVKNIGLVTKPPKFIPLSYKDILMSYELKNKDPCKAARILLGAKTDMVSAPVELTVYCKKQTPMRHLPKIKTNNNK